MNNEWRLYSFVNFYLSPLQYGLQTAHCAVDLVRTFGETEAVTEWADFDKTIIILNGGAQPQLKDIYETLSWAYSKTKLPYAAFYEDEGLNNALTCVSVLLPAAVWERSVEDFWREEFELRCTRELLEGKRLA